MVDEFQDITVKEFKLIRRLSEVNRNLFIIGSVKHGKISIASAVFLMGFDFVTDEFHLFLVAFTEIGKIKMGFLQAYAEEYGTSLYSALKALCRHESMKGCKGAEFVETIEKLRLAADSLPVSELLQMLMKDTGYEPSVSPTRNTLSNSSPLAVWMVISFTHIDERLLDIIGNIPAELKAEYVCQVREFDKKVPVIYKVGDQVRHKVFGDPSGAGFLCRLSQGALPLPFKKYVPALRNRS